jgi:hypothetical protein
MTWLKQMSPFIVVSAVLGLVMALFIIIPVLAALVNSALHEMFLYALRQT